jgi:3-deoxy-manno-octulosonate cytidylyltransferase (CMP-KDO synthetase)
LAIIPARRASTRLPNKPLLDLGGKPLIARAWEAVTLTGVFADVVVATDCPEIADAVHAIGGEVEMTRSDHRSGTDRVAEAAQRRGAGQVIVNVQGDQPWVTVESLTEVLEALQRDGDAPMATVGAPISRPQDLRDPDTVKVVRDRRGRALYFSRAPIGADRAGLGPALHHFGLYAFAPGFVETFAALSRTPLEAAESLEQLRALEHGYPIAVGQISSPLLEVNTPEDLEAARATFPGAG